MTQTYHLTNYFSNQDVCLGASGRELATTGSLAGRRLVPTLPCRTRDSIRQLLTVPETPSKNFDRTFNYQTATVFEHSAVALKNGLSLSTLTSVSMRVSDSST